MFDVAWELPDYVPDDLWAFRVKLDLFVIGRDLTLNEQQEEWLTLFRRTADRFSRIPLEQSFALSFAALCRFRTSGTDFRGYLRRCVVNAHLDYLKHLKAQRAAHKRYKEDRRKRVKNEQDEVDARLDLEVAYGKMPPRLASVLRLSTEDRDGDDIARQMGVSERHVRRLRRQAEGRVRQLLNDGYGPDEPEKPLSSPIPTLSVSRNRCAA